jgi:beta-xylosidase
MEGLAEGSYAVRVLPGESSGDGKLLIATTTYGSAYACAEFLLETYYNTEKGLCIPYDLDVVGTEKEHHMIQSTIRKLRDPCILVEDGVYYAYGTGWHCFKNVSGNLEGPWEDLGVVASVANPDTDGGSHWAPEVHRYNGAFYMFTTYYNSATAHRGCIILKSDSPEGPFVEITNGHITPADWDAIDGTLYVDPEGQPWMVFVHEWTCMPDGVGSFAAAKLSPDLTHFISEPIELFKANEPHWARAGVTDGCWMYTTKEGELLMIWSNFDAFGYVVAVARSASGRLDGEWIHEENLLYSKYMTGEYEGGHGMIFTDVDGQMYLSFHSPNSAIGDRQEKPVFLAIEEKDGMLVWAQSEKKAE